MVQALVGDGVAKRAASTRVLEAAEATHRALGHENFGFLSAERGFMPLAAPELRLPAAFEAWDEVASELPRLYGALSLRKTIDRLPNLSARVAELPDRSLLRACNLLAILTHAYALRNDLGLKNAVTARGEPIAPRSAYKIERLSETQERF